MVEHKDDQFNPNMEGGPQPVLVELGNPTASYLPVPVTWTETMDQQLIRYERLLYMQKEAAILVANRQMKPGDTYTLHWKDKQNPLKEDKTFTMRHDFPITLFKMAHGLRRQLEQEYGALGEDLAQATHADVYEGGNK